MFGIQNDWYNYELNDIFLINNVVYSSKLMNGWIKTDHSTYCKNHGGASSYFFIRPRGLMNIRLNRDFV